MVHVSKVLAPIVEKLEKQIVAGEKKVRTLKGQLKALERPNP